MGDPFVCGVFLAVLGGFGIIFDKKWGKVVGSGKYFIILPHQK